MKEYQMGNCKFCHSKKTLNFLQARYPLVQYPVSKAQKVKLAGKFNPSISLSYSYCDDCGLIFSDLSETNSRFVNKVYRNFYNHASPLMSDVAVSEHLDFLDKARDILLGAVRIMEIGCYDGYLLFQLKKMGKDVVGVEPSRQGARIGRENGIKIINDFFPPRQNVRPGFDVIFSRHLIEHLERPQTFLGEQIRFLKKGGILIFETPNTEWYMLHGNNTAFHVEHRVLMTMRSVLNLADSIKMECVYFKESDHRIIYILSSKPLRGLKSVKDGRKSRISLAAPIRAFQSKVDKDLSGLRRTFAKHLSRKDSIGIWGAGGFTGTLLLQIPEMAGARYIIDSDKRKTGLEYLHSDLPVSSPDILAKDPVDVLFIISQYHDEILGCLRGQGILRRVKRVYGLFPRFRRILR